MADANYRADIAKRRNAPPPKPPEMDPRAPAVGRFVATNAVAWFAVALNNAIGNNRNERIHWIADDQSWNVDADAAKARLKKLKGGALPTGAALLKWLLKQKLADLAAAYAAANADPVDEFDRVTLIAKPTPTELVLFAHCGAKLPPKAKPDPKAAPAAKKPKPTKKKGRK